MATDFLKILDLKFELMKKKGESGWEDWIPECAKGQSTV